MYSIDELRSKVLPVKSWIIDLIQKYESRARPIDHYNFTSLAQYYDSRVLSAVRVVEIDKIPSVPLASLGMPELSYFENGNYDGVTYLNTYFLATGSANRESLHFHEIIHVVQWSTLGIDRFILLYGVLLLKFGYRESPLEQMAYNYQRCFEQKQLISNLVGRISSETETIARQYGV